MYCTQNVTKLKTVKFLITYLITDFMEQKKKSFLTIKCITFLLNSA